MQRELHEWRHAQVPCSSCICVPHGHGGIELLDAAAGLQPVVLRVLVYASSPICLHRSQIGHHGKVSGVLPGHEAGNLLVLNPCELTADPLLVPCLRMLRWLLASAITMVWLAAVKSAVKTSHSHT